MKILPNNKNNFINFSGKRPNDSTYWVIKNPETASDAMEKGYVMDFLKRNPNWEKDEELVHRLKQDTVKARAKGKMHSQWHEIDEPTGLTSLLSAIGLIGVSIALIKNRKTFKNLSNFEKVLYPACIPFFAWLTVDSAKYILTGRNLFEKKKEKTNSNIK